MGQASRLSLQTINRCFAVVTRTSTNSERGRERNVLQFLFHFFSVTGIAAAISTERNGLCLVKSEEERQTAREILSELVCYKKMHTR